MVDDFHPAVDSPHPVVDALHHVADVLHHVVDALHPVVDAFYLAFDPVEGFNYALHRIINIASDCHGFCSRHASFFRRQFIYSSKRVLDIIPSK